MGGATRNERRPPCGLRRQNAPHRPDRSGRCRSRPASAAAKPDASCRKQSAAAAGPPARGLSLFAPLPPICCPAPGDRRRSHGGADRPGRFAGVDLHDDGAATDGVVGQQSWRGIAKRDGEGNRRSRRGNRYRERQFIRLPISAKRGRGFATHAPQRATAEILGSVQPWREDEDQRRSHRRRPLTPSSVRR